jgi:hypothetical protein
MSEKEQLAINTFENITLIRAPFQLIFIVIAYCTPKDKTF